MSNPITLRTDLFHHDAANRVFFAEASALGLPPGVWPQGFYLRSHKTGAAIYVSAPHFVREQETGERGGTDLIAVEYTLKVPNSKRPYTVRILND